MTQDTLIFAEEQIAQGKRVALITVTETKGSSPASVGQMIAVAADGSTVGTVGGGMTEYQVIQKALEAIKEGEKVFHFSFNHAENGMVCGGAMSGIGNILGNENHIYIFGGGHVGQSLVRIAALTGFFVTVVEDRPDFENECAGARYLVCKPEYYEQEMKLSDSDYAVVCTRGHRMDDAALRFCLANSPRYIGMIGSEKKAATLFGRLREEGYSEEALEHVYAPMGLDIADSIPAEIAIAVMAEILLIKNNGGARHKRAQIGIS